MCHQKFEVILQDKIAAKKGIRWKKNSHGYEFDKWVVMVYIGRKQFETSVSFKSPRVEIQIQINFKMKV